AEDAASLARSVPDLDVGLHVTLVEERPLLPAERVPSLVTGGRFWPSHATVFARYAAGRWSADEAAAETAAQWERLAALGIRSSHCDGHQHLHLLPQLFPRVVQLARRHGVRFVRTWLGGPAGAGSATGSCSSTQPSPKRSPGVASSRPPSAPSPPMPAQPESQASARATRRLWVTRDFTPADAAGILALRAATFGDVDKVRLLPE